MEDGGEANALPQSPPACFATSPNAEPSLRYGAEFREGVKPYPALPKCGKNIAFREGAY